MISHAKTTTTTLIKRKKKDRFFLLGFDFLFPAIISKIKSQEAGKIKEGQLQFFPREKRENLQETGLDTFPSVVRAVPPLSPATVPNNKEGTWRENLISKSTYIDRKVILDSTKFLPLKKNKSEMDCIYMSTAGDVAALPSVRYESKEFRPRSLVSSLQVRLTKDV